MKLIHLCLIILNIWLGLKCLGAINETVGRVRDLRVKFFRKADDKGAKAWTSGVKCVYSFAELYFEKILKLSRAFNIVTTQVYNLTMPAAFIQRHILQHLNEQALKNVTRRHNYQVRVMSDAKPFDYDITNTRELLLADYYILILDNVDDLKRILRDYLMRSVSWNPGAKFLLLYHNVDERNETEMTSMKIFNELLDTAFVTNVALLYATSATSYDMVAPLYYHEIDCRQLRTYVFGQCDSGSFTPTQLVLKAIIHKLYNQISAKNCTFYVCAAIWAPFVEEDCISGIELKMVDFLRERLHFVVNTTCTYGKRGILEPSGSYSGLLGKLDDKTCDIAFGGFYPDDDIIFDFWVTDCYMQDSYTWYVKLADERPVWLALYNIFDDSTWYGFFGLLLASWLFWYACVNLLPEPKNSRDVTITGLNTFAVFIALSINERPICHATRIFFVALNLYALNLTAIFVSKLISVFTDPGLMPQIHTLEEVIEAGLPFGGLEEAHDWFDTEDDRWIYDMYNVSSHFIASTANLEQVKRGHRVLLCSRMYALQHPIADSIWGFPENVFSSPVQMIMKPGFILRYEINLLIRRMRDFGIFEKINDDFLYNNSYLNRISKMRPEFNERIIVLTLKHLWAPFVLLYIGLMASFLVFLLELLINRSNAIQNILNRISIKSLLNKKKSDHLRGQLKNASDNLLEESFKRKRKRRQIDRDNEEFFNKRHLYDNYYDDNVIDKWNHNERAIRLRFTPPHRRIVYK